ncbi:hypothetical protein [Mucilaginibacter arboris]|uniref:Glycoside hydrolase family 65 n=1 Tax=Mucilaginibacter arboris TaxID=2682090 RepID=A0A7K1SW01_9SPHI|nr:hypothetical protein [Mucilaginibacter arboris]MVN21408.1 hypothetical protein [Mucilaginibacter arboris]
MKSVRFITFITLFISFFSGLAQKIDRKAVVGRHNVIVHQADTLSSLTVGNGKFAFTVDATGLQTFPEVYAKGVPLGTESEWGWHSFPNKENYRFENSLKEYDLDGKKIKYSVQWHGPEINKESADYFRINQHRLQLGNIGLDIYKKDGSLISLEDVKNIHQELDLWKGEISSKFTIEGVPVEVITCAHQTKDEIAAKVTSPLIQEGRLELRIRFPYPTGAFADFGSNYKNNEKHQSAIIQNQKNGAVFKHVLDTTTYYLTGKWSDAIAKKKPSHYYTILPDKRSNTFQFSFLFSPKIKNVQADGFAKTEANSQKLWNTFWQSGAAVDFAGSTDKRAFELERRVVLSQYLEKVQCAGNFPPQETGLTYNSWYGKPHMEMFWWHAAHYAFWNRTDLLEKSMNWYFTAYKGAKDIAKRQGFKGVRWQKMTDNEGRESPSSVGALLIWQQPHLIYLAELIYRDKKSMDVLNKYKELVFATADFMASFPTFDAQNNRYNLGKGMIPAQECFNAVDTFNPTYELAYWDWALNIAQQWRLRLGLPRKKEWDLVLNKLARLPQKNGVYLAAESVPDCYSPDSKYLTDHPAVLAALSTIPPSHQLDTAVMHTTFNLVKKAWHWEHTWGWDFPMVAMTATRLNVPEEAIDALFKNVETNTYLQNGHNYQDKRLTIYLPGNGGLLAAVAMMCAGWDGKKTENPGFPKNGEWKVRWEGFKPMP